MNPIRTDKPVFFGNDGAPLKGGFIYIGLPGQDPQSFPKTVTFEDSAGSQITAAQPLKTNSDGQVSYNGKAIIALVTGNYSMLIQDSNQVQIKSGWYPTVQNADGSAGSFDEVTRTGTLLADIKQFDVTPGDTVKNVGEITALDGLGAIWLVVSNTGTGGDDIDLIDFDNGTQGQRIDNVLYSKDVGPGASQVPRNSDLGTASLQAYIEDTFAVAGTGASFNVEVVQVGNQVTLRIPAFTHDLSTGPTFASAIPAAYRPPADVSDVLFSMDATELRAVNFGVTGQLSFDYNDYTGGAVSRTSTGKAVYLTYTLV